MNHPELNYQVYQSIYQERIDMAAQNRRLQEQRRGAADGPTLRDRVLLAGGQLLITLGTNLQTQVNPRHLATGRSVTPNWKQTIT